MPPHLRASVGLQFPALQTPPCPASEFLNAARGWGLQSLRAFAGWTEPPSFFCAGSLNFRPAIPVRAALWRKTYAPHVGMSCNPRARGVVRATNTDAHTRTGIWMVFLTATCTASRAARHRRSRAARGPPLRRPLLLAMWQNGNTAIFQQNESSRRVLCVIALSSARVIRT